MIFCHDRGLADHRMIPHRTLSAHVDLVDWMHPRRSLTTTYTRLFL